MRNTNPHSQERAEDVTALLALMRLLGIHAGTRTDLEEIPAPALDSLWAFVIAREVTA